MGLAAVTFYKGVEDENGEHSETGYLVQVSKQLFTSHLDASENRIYLRCHQTNGGIKEGKSDMNGGFSIAIVVYWRRLFKLAVLIWEIKIDHQTWWHDICPI